LIDDIVWQERRSNCGDCFNAGGEGFLANHNFCQVGRLKVETYRFDLAAISGKRGIGLAISYQNVSSRQLAELNLTPGLDFSPLVELRIPLPVEDSDFLFSS
jgi:hypothetical protein